MQILVGCLLLSRQVSSFDFGDIFEQAFGGGGGNFQFQFGGHGGAHGGRQQQRQTSFPSHVKNTITDEFAWLRGTEWNWNGYDMYRPRYLYLFAEIQSVLPLMEHLHHLLENALSRNSAYGLHTRTAFT